MKRPRREQIASIVFKVSLPLSMNSPEPDLAAMVLESLGLSVSNFEDGGADLYVLEALQK